MQTFSSNNHHRLYSDLSWTWPIISPPEDYIQETEWFCKIIREHSQIEVKTLLNLGCGGGHNDYTLKTHFSVTGLDTSGAMLNLARKLNPEATYLLDDMRTVRLGVFFDAVTIFDSVNYMLSVQDLRAAFTTAFEHLKPGGVFLTLVEESVDCFHNNKTTCSTHVKGDIEITFIENYYDPDPTDTTFEATFIYLIRRGSRLEIETDHHLCGIFDMKIWLDQLRGVGFDVKQLELRDPNLGERSYPMLLCIKAYSSK